MPKSKNTGRELREGTKLHFVAVHFDKTAPEIVAAAKSQKMEIDPTYVHTARSKLRHKYGLKKPLLAIPSTPKAQRPSAPPAPPESQSPEPVGNAKVAQLRRLIFELGFDTARAVFTEFTHLHSRLP